MGGGAVRDEKTTMTFSLKTSDTFLTVKGGSWRGSEFPRDTIWGALATFQTPLSLLLLLRLALL